METSAAVLDVGKMKRELHRVIDLSEELEIRTRVNRKSQSDAMTNARVQLRALQERREKLREILQDVLSRPTPLKQPERAPGGGPHSTKQPNVIARLAKSAAVQVLMTALNGAITVVLYFADLASDLQVVALLHETGNYEWALASASIVVLQFLVVWVRVLPYMRTTFGASSPQHLGFVLFGFPVGLLLFDVMMFLEPIGLLAVLPLPAWLRAFMPAYKATRIIAEIYFEALPQSCLQAYIYVVVVTHARAGTATASEAAVLSFASLLPKSILISTLATLKTWIELVDGSRQAGLSVFDRAMQLWNVGAGLPLDALKKGAMTAWACPYHLHDSEVPPLLDALSKNASLTHLDLSRSGITWDGADASGMGLLETMSKQPSPAHIKVAR